MVELEVKNGLIRVSDPQSGLGDVRHYFEDPWLTQVEFYPTIPLE